MPGIELSKLLAVAFGGALGSVCRLLCGAWVASFAGKSFPWGTMSVNVIGSLLIGLVYVLLLEKFRAPEIWTHLLIIGVLGGFTTFSAFSLDTVSMLSQGEVIEAFAYVLGTVTLCLLSTATGLWLARLV